MGFFTTNTKKGGGKNISALECNFSLKAEATEQVLHKEFLPILLVSCHNLQCGFHFHLAFSSRCYYIIPIPQ